MGASYPIEIRERIRTPANKDLAAEKERSSQKRQGDPSCNAKAQVACENPSAQAISERHYTVQNL